MNEAAIGHALDSGRPQWQVSLAGGVEMADRQGPASPTAEPDLVHPLSVNGIHLLRTAQQLQMQLSQMADQKASMLMGATFLVFTIGIGQLRSGGGAMLLPIAILSIAAFFSAIFAVLTVLPRPTRLTAEQIGPDDNLLFFGVFTAIPEAEFIDRVVGRTMTDDSVYRTIARDIYQNGQVLQRSKYRYLGYAYRIFLAGLILTAIAACWELVREWLI
jgi:hypothetical protein